MLDFNLQCPPSHKGFDPWDVQYVLLLIISWTHASSLNNLQLLGILQPF